MEISQNPAPVIRVEGVGKRYCRSLRRSVAYAALDVAAEFAFWQGTDRQAPLRPGEFWALRNASFSLLPGECLGVIGPNGAGKSTLLKLIAGIIKPDEGIITVRGSVSALFVQGPGFHPLLTGRQNLFVAGAILGYRDREVRQREEDIVRFADIGAAIDSPVFTYSSGMVARLGFAVAAHLEPDLLLVDEVLAVGDADFQARCLERIHELRKRGTALLVVSHNPYQISRFCDSALVLVGGTILRTVTASEAVAEHYLQINEAIRSRPPAASPSSSRPGSIIQAVEIRQSPVSNQSAGSIPEVETHSRVTIRIHHKAESSVDRPVFGVAIRSEAGQLLYSTASFGVTEDQKLAQGCTDLILPDLCLMPGRYEIGVHLGSSLGRVDEIASAAIFVVVCQDSALLRRSANRGIISMHCHWETPEAQN